MSDRHLKAGPSYRILIYDPNPDDSELIQEPLKWEGFQLKVISAMDEAIKIVPLWSPHVVLLDLSEVELKSEVVEKFVKESPHSSFIVLSDKSETEMLIKILDEGADDFIVKPFVPLEYLARIRTHLRNRDLREDLVYANEKLKELVNIDDLTGLFNMRSLYEKLDYEIERARRFSRSVCVCMMDMDHFKSVNDGHDHLFGSYVLSQVGRIIKANTRNIDIPARYGGDEFMVVLSEIGSEGAIYFCERLRKSIESTTFTHGDDNIKLTASLGFALLDPAEVIGSKELVRRADRALYASKHAGRNQVTEYSPEFDIISLDMKKKKSKAS
ncbi:MAG: diguanylate cyclase [Bdellovibrionota bacterium]